MEILKPKAQKYCTTCGVEISACRTYCESCSAARRLAHQRGRKDGPRKQTCVTCQYCWKQTWRRVRGGESDCGKFCDRKCAAAHHSKIAREIAGIRRLSEPKEQRHCIRCSAVLPNGRLTYCSEKCWPSRYQLKEIYPKKCKLCGETFMPQSLWARHCDACRRNGNRISRNMRKAKVRGATVERVNPMLVLERDKWRCQLCGLKMKKAKRGTNGWDAPEVDHIIPLSHNGEHSYRNLQCLCRKCNLTKSATVRGQLLLIG